MLTRPVDHVAHESRPPRLGHGPCLPHAKDSLSQDRNSSSDRPALKLAKVASKRRIWLQRVHTNSVLKEAGNSTRYVEGPPEYVAPCLKLRPTRRLRGAEAIRRGGESGGLQIEGEAHVGPGQLHAVGPEP
jgi:hypothetical protein